MIHLVRRFFGSIFARNPDVKELQWVSNCLSEAEFSLWRKYSREDQRHTINTARRVESKAHVSPGDWRIAASLLHDVGKTVSPLGTFRRVIATLFMRSMGRRRFAKWADKRGWIAMRDYVNHPRLGEELLLNIGSDPRVCTWAGEHHLKAGRSSLSPTDVAILLAADN